MTPAALVAACIDLIGAIEADRRPADAVANAFFRARRYIGGGDRRAISARVWRTIRWRRKLGWWLGEPTPRLLIAATMLFTGTSPAALDAAFSGDRFAPAKLSEDERARLRKAERRSIDDPRMPEPVRLEVPDWLLPRLRARFGPGLDDELRALAEPAPLDLRANLLKATRDEAAEALRADGIEAAPTPLSPWGLRVPGRVPVTSGAPFRDGLVEIQDEGSQIVALLADARPGMRVLDWCAGAGGKTLALAMTMANKGTLVACDVSAARLDASVRRLRRAGVHNVERHRLEAGDKWAKRREGGFDRVLVDAPCTGTGTWRRNPDARLRLTETDLAELTARQSALLASAARLVRAGGRLVYATCSVLTEENEARMADFLSSHPGFAPISPAAVAPAISATPGGQGEVLRLTPAADGTDGFFCAVLERRA